MRVSALPYAAVSLEITISEPEWALMLWSLTIHRFSQFDYSLRCMFPKWSDWQINYTPKGLLKKRMRRGLAYAAFIATLVALHQARKHDGHIRSLPSLLQHRFTSLASGLLDFANHAIGRAVGSV